MIFFNFCVPSIVLLALLNMPVVALPNTPTAADDITTPTAGQALVKKSSLFDRKEGGGYQYNHYSCQTKEGREIEEIYTQFIDKGHQILDHLHNQKVPFEHQLNILETYQDYSPYWLQHGFTCGGLSWFTSPPTAQIKHQQAYLESIICVVWALTEKAFQRGDVLDRGAFIIPDNEFRLLNFLQGYCLLVSGCKSWEDFVDTKNPISTSNLAYSRTHKNWFRVSLSSHFTENRTKFQAGIDCRFGSSEQSMPYFPFNMSHLLFGKVNTHNGKTVTFIKPEPSGMGDFRSIFSHGFEYIFNNQGSHLRREKDIPDSIAELALALANSILTVNVEEASDWDVVTTFKLEETSDCNLVTTFKTLREQNKLTLDRFTESKRIDIASLWDLTQHILDPSQLPDSELREKAKELRKKMIELYPQSLEYRTGNEVLLEVNDLLLNSSSIEEVEPVS